MHEQFDIILDAADNLILKAADVCKDLEGFSCSTILRSKSLTRSCSA